MTNVREEIILATCRLLEKQGYPATGLNEIVKESGAPKGSLYYYFPEGKEQIISEAVRYAGQILVERMRTGLIRVDDPLQALYEFINHQADQVEKQHFTAGSPLTIVSVEAAGSSERISQACRAVYDQIEAVLQERLACCGLTEAEAAEQARLTLASLEGGMILSRVHHSAAPLRSVARHLKDSMKKAVEK